LIILINNICIEFDGEQHYISKDCWGGENALLETQKRDKIKTEYCEKNSIGLLRIKYIDINNIETILNKKLLNINV
jgi:hypothetical protein